MLKHTASVLLISVLLVLAGGAIASSDAFQICMNVNHNQVGDQQAKEGIAQILATIDPYRSCAGEFLIQNGESVTAVFAIILAISTILLWRSVRAQSINMDKLIKQAARSANAMEAISKMLAISAESAINSVTTLRESAARQTRAYLTVVVGGAVYQDRAQDLKFAAMPALVNTGQTPAYNVQYRAKANFLPFPLPDNVDLTLPEGLSWIGGAVLGPRQTSALNATVDNFLPDPEVEEIKVGRARRLYIWGSVTYRDVFGETHQTDFSQSIAWLPDGKIVADYLGQDIAT